MMSGRSPLGLLEVAMNDGAEYQAEEFRAGKAPPSHSHTASAGWLGKHNNFSLTVSTVSLTPGDTAPNDATRKTVETV
jgi:hypothetical protein